LIFVVDEIPDVWPLEIYVYRLLRELITIIRKIPIDLSDRKRIERNGRLTVLASEYFIVWLSGLAEDLVADSAAHSGQLLAALGLGGAVAASLLGDLRLGGIFAFCNRVMIQLLEEWRASNYQLSMEEHNLC
jgi:hypothetical protein